MITRLKRGRISRAEDKSIAKMVAQQIPVKEIAEKLKRPIGQIETFVKKFYGYGDNLPAKAPETAEFIRELRGRTEWQFLQEQYQPDELSYYEELYAKLMTQFKDDILPTEELQIFQAIDTAIFINRHKKARRVVEDQILDIDRQINIEKSNANINIEKVHAMEGVKQQLIAQSNMRTREFTELSKKFDETIAKLKGTREQRFKTIESSRQSWTALIKSLQDKKVREREDRHLALVKLATEQETTKLQQPHKYINGKVDQPLLVPENILITDDDNAKEDKK